MKEPKTMKELKARYSVATIVTNDPSIIVKSSEIRKTGKTHEDIYIAGLSVLSNK